MTNQEFNNYFKMEILPLIAKQYEQDGIPDKPARREEYNNLMDDYQSRSNKRGGCERMVHP